MNFEPDYLFQLRQVLRTNPEMGAKFAQMLVTEGGDEPLADINQVPFLLFLPFFLYFLNFRNAIMRFKKSFLTLKIIAECVSP